MARILVVDDNPDFRKALKIGLARAGHAVALADNGNDALRVTAAQNFDIAIIDIIMPDKEGIETIIELKQVKPSLKIIAMSGGGQTRYLGFLDAAKKFGAQETLAKPFRMGELLETVGRCLVPGAMLAGTDEGD